MSPLETLLTRIAQQHLGIETLETQRSDRLDFHDTAVWSLKAALTAAYQAGVDAANAQKAQAQRAPAKRAKA